MKIKIKFKNCVQLYVCKIEKIFYYFKSNVTQYSPVFSLINNTLMYIFIYIFYIHPFILQFYMYKKYIYVYH